MALVTTAFTIAPSFFGIVNLPDPVTQRSNIPRQELYFNSFAQVIPVATGGDTQLLTEACILPIGFAYAAMEFYMSVVGADAADWGGTGILSIRDGIEDVDTDYRIHLVSPTNAVGLGAVNVDFRSYCFEPPLLPKRIILPQTGGSLWSFQVGNTTADGSAMTANISARFLQYDIAQAHDFEVNTPTLVR